MMEASGWKCMCSYKGFFFFAAKPGTTEIYTDKVSYLEKYRKIKSYWQQGIIYSFTTFILLFVINYFVPSTMKNGVYHFLFFIFIGCSVGIFLPSMMVCVSYYFRERNMLKSKFQNI